ncbi:MAG: hypothetical protein Tsb0034_13850 [Ekhidna sp.]
MSFGQKFYWAKDDGEKDYSSTAVFKTAVDSNDDIVVFGTARERFENEDGVILNDSSYNYFLAKYSPEGTMIWYKALGSSGYIGNSPRDVAMTIDADDKIYVAAFIPFNQSINVDGFIADYVGGGTSINDDFFVARFDSDGNREMAFRQGADDAYVNGMAVDASGNIYLAGSYSGSIDFETTRTSSGMVDAFLAKFNEDGTPLWSRSAGNPTNTDKSYAVEVSGSNVYWGYYLRSGTDYFTRVDKVTDGNGFRWRYEAFGTESGYSNSGSDLSVSGTDVYLFGNFGDEISLPTATGSQVLTAPGNNQVFIAKIRDSGFTRNLVWGIQEGGPGYDNSNDIEATASHVYISKTESGITQFMRFSADGGAIPLNTLEPDHPYSGGSSPYSLSLLSDGSLIAGGSQTGNFGFGDVIHVSRSMFILRTDALLGEPAWLKGTFNHSFYTEASTHDSQGNMYVVGAFSGEYNDGTEILYGQGASDMFIKKYDEFGNTSFIRLATSKTNVRPNTVEVFGDHIYVAGTYEVDDGSYQITFHDGTTLGGDEGREGFLAKYTLEGDLVWGKRAASTEGDLDVFDLDINAAEEIYLVGEALGGSPKNFGNGVTKSFSDQGFFLAKYNSDGEAQWAEMVNDTEGSVVAVKSTGEVAVAGQYSANITFNGVDLTNSGSKDVFVA